MNIHEMLLKQLNPRLAIWRQANLEAPRPPKGWVRTIRKALGITIAQLAKRFNVNPSRVVAIEMAEPRDAITLKTLREIASAMECEFVYALVPKNSLASIIKDRATEVVKNRMQRVSHSMALEDQAVSKDYQEEQMQDLIKLFSSKPRLLNSLWNKVSVKTTGHKKPNRNPN